MKHINSKQLFFVLIRTTMLVCSIYFGVQSSWADESTPENKNTVHYQSTFEGYQSVLNESLGDWITINQNAESGHSGHQMQGMQHDMNSMGNMQPQVNQAIVHAETGHNSSQHNTIEPSNGVSKMEHQQMRHGNPNSNTAKTPQAEKQFDSDISTMKHDAMQEMAYQHKTARHAAAEMDHRNMKDMKEGESNIKNEHAEMTHLDAHSGESHEQ